MVGGRDGFTLAEALIAVTIATIVILMASTLFVIQNDYYNYVMERSLAQDNARSVTELVASEVRALSPGSIILADSTRFAFRKPAMMGLVCARSSVNGSHFVHVSEDLAEVDSTAVAGVAVQDSSGTWVFQTAAWSAIHAGTASAAQWCRAQGADTTGATSSFFHFADLASLSGDSTDVGDAVMLFSTIELRFAQSGLDTTSVAFYRGTYGDTLVEFATGMDSSARFSYRLGDTTHYSSISSGNLADIDGVRIRASARARERTSSHANARADLTTDFLLRNSNEP